MADKILNMGQALGLVPGDGARLALGGLTLYRRPMQFTLALIRAFEEQGAPHRICLLSFTSGLEGDLLVGAGMVAEVRSCYFGLEVFGLAPQFTAAAGRGEIKITEESEASLASGLRASMAGVGFMPSRAWHGTDLPTLRPDVRTVVDPYSDEVLMAFPALQVDVAVIHVLEADPDGNARIGGNPGVDPELALIADTVIVTAEEIVDSLQTADILGPVVDTVVPAPNGAWPTSCHPIYPLDGEAILAYLDVAGTPDLAALLDQWRSRTRHKD